jgi:hypothetical protein
MHHRAAQLFLPAGDAARNCLSGKDGGLGMVAATREEPVPVHPGRRFSSESGSPLPPPGGAFFHARPGKLFARHPRTSR